MLKGLPSASMAKGPFGRSHRFAGTSLRSGLAGSPSNAAGPAGRRKLITVTRVRALRVRIASDVV